VQHNEILHVGDIARITEKEVLELFHGAMVTVVPDVSNSNFT